MRLIHATVPSDKREEVLEVLEERGLDYAVFEETSDRGYSDVIQVPVLGEDVETLLDEFRSVGLEKNGYIVVNEVDVVVSERFEELKREREEESEEEESEEEEDNGGRISRDELKATADELAKSEFNYAAFTVLSAVVATAGLMIDSAAVVVGSMVIAPLIGPAMASSVGTVIRDDGMFRDGVKLQFLGIGLAIASATVTAAVARVVFNPHLDILLVQQVSERVNPGLLALVIALGAGVAGALALTSGVDTALVGVMIAAALVPPAAAAGLGIAYFEPVVTVSSTILLILNLFTINLAGLVTLWYKGYRPERWYEESVAKKVTLKRVGALLAAVLVLSSVMAYTTYNHRQNQSFEQKVRDIAETETDPQKIEFSYDRELFRSYPSAVTVYTSSTRNGLPQQIRGEIQEETGREVKVAVIHESVAR